MKIRLRNMVSVILGIIGVVLLTIAFLGYFSDSSMMDRYVFSKVAMEKKSPLYLQWYLDRYPRGLYSRTIRNILLESDYWADFGIELNMRESFGDSNIDLCLQYLRNYPDGQYADKYANFVNNHSEDIYVETVHGLNLIMRRIKESPNSMRNEHSVDIRDATEDDDGEPNVWIEEFESDNKLGEYWIGTREITIRQYKIFCELNNIALPEEIEHALMGYYVLDGRGKKRTAGMSRFHPMSHVSWEDAMRFCDWLTSETNRTYNLPTDAEWRYACYGNKNTMYHYGDDETMLVHYAWFRYNSSSTGSFVYNMAITPGGAQPVALLTPNHNGLYDMHGNVDEWVRNRLKILYVVVPRVPLPDIPDFPGLYGLNKEPKEIYYPTEQIQELREAQERIKVFEGVMTNDELSSHDPRLIWGGNYHSSASDCALSEAYGRPPTYRDETIGFRVMMRK